MIPPRFVVFILLCLPFAVSRTARAQAFCTESPPGPPNACVGDPVDVVNGNSYNTYDDIEIPTSVGRFTFTRIFNSKWQAWSPGGASPIENVTSTPLPFGAFGDSTLLWWHNYFSYVSELPSTGLWTARTPDGGIHYFNVCSPLPCTASNNSTFGPSERSLLRRDAAGVFTMTQPDGTAYVYDGTADFALSNGSNTIRHFLTGVRTPSGATLASLTYAPPTDSSNVPLANCTPLANPGSAPGAGYIRTITLAEGNTLTLYYQATVSNIYPQPANTCSLSSIVLHDRSAGGADTVMATYSLITYPLFANVSRGLIGNVSLPFKGTDGTGSFTEADFNTRDPITYVSSSGQTLFSQVLQFAPPSGSVPSIDVASVTTPFEQMTFVTRSPDSTPLASETLSCSLKSSPEQVTYPVTDQTTGVGDGSGTSSPLTTRFTSIANPAFVDTGRLYRTSQSVAAGSAAANWFVPASVQNEWTCPAQGIPMQPRGDKDPRGAWSVYTQSQGGLTGFPQLTEQTSVKRGSSTIDGIDALSATNFTYAYANNQQLVATTSQASVLSANSQMVVHSIYDPTVPTRLAATIREGWTTNSAGSVVKRYVGTFYLTRQACSGGSVDDPFHRTLEVHGPCLVNGVTSTDCDAGGTAPVTQYTYNPPSTTSNAGSRLAKISHFVSNANTTSCATASHLDTTFDTYDAFGNATATTDPNGVQTTLTFNGNLLATSTTNRLTTRYTYDDARVTSIQYPEGNYELFCYRDGANCTGNWTNRLQWKAKSSMANGATWTEKVSFSYWPDGTVKQESYLDSAGNVRRTVHHASNVLKQPTYTKVGDGAFNAFRDLRQFNAAGDVTAIGFAFNNPPDFCGTPGSTPSPLCAGTNVDRLGRLASLDQFPAGTTPGSRTNVAYDAQGNVQTIQPGCTTAGGACTAPAAQYAYDDFGNVASVTAPWLDNGQGGSGTTRFTYDAMGNVLTKQTAAMAGHGDTLSYAYDGLGRLLSAVHNYTTPSVGSETLYSLAYDGGSAPPSGCPTVSNTRGRISSRSDSFGTTWYNYDVFGRPLEEVRVRAGLASCTGASVNDVPHTTYGYSNNGNLTSIGYPFGRTVTYGYGTVAQGNDRITSVSVTTFNGTSWTSQSVIQSVAWEPYGGLRGYQIAHPLSGAVSTVEYMLGDDGTVAPAPGCPTAVPSATASDHTGRLRGLWVSSGAQALGAGTGDLYKRTYTWKADQIVRTDSCALAATVPHTETYGYDALLRLTSAGRPTGGAMADVGGPFDVRSYGYDGRGNRTSQVSEDCAYTLGYASAAHPDELAQRAAACNSSMLKYSYTYDRDGRVATKTWAQTLDGSPPYSMTFAAGETDASSNGALDTVLKSASVNGAVYNYFYDAFNRRRLKVYPTGVKDEFFHSMADELIVDRGLSSVTSPTALPIDEYVWLGGRPVVLVRGQLSTTYARQSDATASCPRNGDAAACGFYFPITDHIGKPVLMLDAQRRVAGIGEYDPFGHVNRVAIDKVSGTNVKDSPHPYDPASLTTIQLGQFDQPVGGSANPSTSVVMRALLHLVSIEVLDSVPTASLSLVDTGTSATLWSSTDSGSNLWSPWVTPSAGRASLRFTTTGWPPTSCPGIPGGNGASPSAALVIDPPPPCVPTNDLTGVVPEAFEYRRYQSGAQWFWTPLRFPGQYFDAETDLAQNWNRFHTAAEGRFFAHEPLLDQKVEADLDAVMSRTVPVYGYATNNPLTDSDPSGLMNLRLPSPAPIFPNGFPWHKPRPKDPNDSCKVPAFKAPGGGGDGGDPGGLCFWDYKAPYVGAGASFGFPEAQYVKSCWYVCPPSGWRKRVVFEATSASDSSCPFAVLSLGDGM